MVSALVRNACPALAVLALVAGCAERSEPTAGSGPASGYWQATISLPGGDIETGIELKRVGDSYQATLINGRERIRIEEVEYEDDELLLRFPAFNNEIRATHSDGRLTGTLTLVKRYGVTDEMPFHAMRGSAEQVETPAPALQDLSGRWAVTFYEPDGSETQSVGEFAQRVSVLFGTFLNPNGDHRFLAGHVRRNEFHLTTFDGAHAFVFSGRVGEDGRIHEADFWSGTTWHQKWSAERNANAQLPDAYSRTHLNPGYERFEFAFPDQDGNIVSLADEKFGGKVVVVTIAGTWCPNCNDEARFLAPLYKEYRGKGLEIVALLFEHFDDHELAARQVRRFRDKFGIEYDTLIAGISDKTEAGRALPALNAVLAFPTTLFIDRGGRVRQIHTGFMGPGTGEHYEKLQAEFRTLITSLLAEPADLIEASGTATANADTGAASEQEQ